jgi:hypothetical protein
MRQETWTDNMSRDSEFMKQETCPASLRKRTFKKRKLNQSQNRSGCPGEERNVLPLPGIESRFLGRQAHSLVTILIELPRLTLQ